MELENTINSLFETGKEMLFQGQDTEAILAFLKDSGCSKIDSIKVIRNLKQISLGEAKDIVHFSRTWQDRSKEDEAFHDDLEKTLNQVDQVQ